ncbi:putative serine/threonine protein phosphatase 2A regulatory subunit B''delta-like isoform X1 [Hibiscus syriacus]|uniref:Serine/threonine protein phosphatase 2A regulatory subunit B''delta-like isoform X1 n=1 Tax=Hibiscus syriacus TaxID=106335 RepID=A0A6A3AUY7_HIBSY|nr:putative serine/threonine protein phosphatase 2A regulatory subunit B''delta-like isoform X1 [Hibiscus syriacus]
MDSTLARARLEFLTSQNELLDIRLEKLASKFTDGEPGASSPLQRSIKPASVGSADSHKASKPNKLNTGTPSHENRLSQSVSSLPKTKDIGGVTPDIKVSMARIRRLSESKTSSSPLVSSVKSRNSEPSKKTKVSDVPESKKISAIVNHDKSKIVSLPELKIKTTKVPNITSSKSEGNAMTQKVTGSISSTIDVNEPSRNKEKVPLNGNEDDSTVVEKTVVILKSIPVVNSSEGTTVVQKENDSIAKIWRETKMASDYAAIHAPGNVSNIEKESSKFTCTSVAENQYQAPLARVSSLEDPCTKISEYDRASPASMKAPAIIDLENVRALVDDTSDLKLEKIPEVLDKPQVKESSKGFRRLLKFGKKNHSSTRSEHSVDSNSEVEELVVNIVTSSEVHTLNNLISQDETLTTGNTPQKSSRSFSLLSPFRSKTSEKKYSA